MKMHTARKAAEASVSVHQSTIDQFGVDVTVMSLQSRRQQHLIDDIAARDSTRY